VKGGRSRAIYVDCCGVLLGISDSYCSSSLRYINENLAVDSGRYIYMDRLYAVVTIFEPWLNLPGEVEMAFL